MKLLLDTHAFLWFVRNDPKLCATARNAVAAPQNEVFLSPASYRVSGLLWWLISLFLGPIATFLIVILPNSTV